MNRAIFRSGSSSVLRVTVLLMILTCQLSTEAVYSKESTESTPDALPTAPLDVETKTTAPPSKTDDSVSKSSDTVSGAKTNIYDESDLETAPPETVKKHWFWLKHGPSFLKLRYYFAAQNAADCEFFYGMVQDNPFLGRASIDFNSENGCKCHGVAQVTHVPLKGNGAGQRGYIHVKCEDGRHMKGHFSTTSVTTGFADLTDDRGHKFEATFGHSADQAVDKVNALRKKLGCPEVTAQEIETKVNAEILHRPKK